MSSLVPAYPEDLQLAPLSLPRDAYEILRLHYQVYLSDALHLPDISSRKSESEFISSGLASIMTRFSKPGVLTAKLSSHSEPSVILSYIVFTAPFEDERNEEQIDVDLRKAIEELSDGLKKEVVYELKKEDRVLNKKFLGEGYESRWWALDALVTDERYQRRGLGSRLVDWGLGKVEEDVKKRRKAKEREADGCYLIASPQGVRIYEKAGFVRVGERTANSVEGDYTHGWFIRRLSELIVCNLL
jgi:GNAT superfamily N-acetyltransferase